MNIDLIPVGKDPPDNSMSSSRCRPAARRNLMEAIERAKANADQPRTTL